MAFKWSVAFVAHHLFHSSPKTRNSDQDENVRVRFADVTLLTGVVFETRVLKLASCTNAIIFFFILFGTNHTLQIGHYCVTFFFCASTSVHICADTGTRAHFHSTAHFTAVITDLRSIALSGSLHWMRSNPLAVLCFQGPAGLKGGEGPQGPPGNIVSKLLPWLWYSTLLPDISVKSNAVIYRKKKSCDGSILFLYRVNSSMRSCEGDRKSVV